MKYHSKKDLVLELVRKKFQMDGCLDAAQIKAVIIDPPFNASPSIVDNYLELKVNAGIIRFNSKDHVYEYVKKGGGEV